jgi:hypothetical protein
MRMMTMRYDDDDALRFLLDHYPDQPSGSGSYWQEEHGDEVWFRFECAKGPLPTVVWNRKTNRLRFA